MAGCCLGLGAVAEVDADTARIAAGRMVHTVRFTREPAPCHMVGRPLGISAMLAKGLCRQTTPLQSEVVGTTDSLDVGNPPPPPPPNGVVTSHQRLRNLGLGLGLGSPCKGAVGTDGSRILGQARHVGPSMMQTMNGKGRCLPPPHPLKKRILPPLRAVWPALMHQLGLGLSQNPPSGWVGYTLRGGGHAFG